jgi:hypothetical protein
MCLYNNILNRLFGQIPVNYDSPSCGMPQFVTANVGVIADARGGSKSVITEREVMSLFLKSVMSSYASAMPAIQTNTNKHGALNP